MSIPEEAVIAAAKVLIREQSDGWSTYRPEGHPKRDDLDRDADAHARAALEAAAPYSMNAQLVQQVLDLHSEDMFRGHLSNGCVICGPDNDVHYPCRTVQLLRKALEAAA